MRRISAIVLLGCAIAGPFAVLHAETRGKPYSEAQLLEMSKKVFVGEVLETRTFEKHKRTVPTRARVLVSIKGNVRQEERAVIPKDPGISVYFAEEFSQANKGRLGVFYVGTNDQPDLLLGYKQLPESRQ